MVPSLTDDRDGRVFWCGFTMASHAAAGDEWANTVFFANESTLPWAIRKKEFTPQTKCEPVPEALPLKAARGGNSGCFKDKIMKTHNNLILAILTATMLSACGGGSGGGTGDNRDNTGNTGIASLSWTAPSSRTDNSYLPMTELQGYRIYYGTSANDLSMLVDLNDNTITEYTVTDLATGSYFFSVTAYDSNGLESGRSNLINKDV